MSAMSDEYHIRAALDEALRAQKLDRKAAIWLRWAGAAWAAVGAVSLWMTF